MIRSRSIDKGMSSGERRMKARPWISTALLLIVWMSCSIARASEADALRISANIQAIHLPFGTILDPIYASASSGQIVGYTRCGDSALWTGTYLAAEAFRYNVTQSSDALNNVKTEVVLVFWTEKRFFLDRGAALKMEKSQCPKPARVTPRA